MDKDSKIRIAACDDHGIFLSGIKLLIESVPKYRVVAQYHTGKDLLHHIPNVGCDVLLLDINLPDRNGIDLLKQLKVLVPTCKVIILSMHTEPSMIMRALKSGADGYLHKDSESKELFKAIETVLNNDIYLVAESNQRIIKKALAQGQEKLLPHEHLSDRELEVLIMLGQGLTSQEISNNLSLSPKTISTYKQRLLFKMNMKRDVQLFEYVKDHSLV